MTTYTTLSDDDLLLIARDTLRGRESDRYRISLLNEPNKEQRLAQYDDEIEALRAEVERLEAVTAPDPVVDEEADAPDAVEE